MRGQACGPRVGQAGARPQHHSGAALPAHGPLTSDSPSRFKLLNGRSRARTPPPAGPVQPPPALADRPARGSASGGRKGHAESGLEIRVTARGSAELCGTIRCDPRIASRSSFDAVGNGEGQGPRLASRRAPAGRRGPPMRQGRRSGGAPLRSRASAIHDGLPRARCEGHLPPGAGRLSIYGKGLSAPPARGRQCPRADGRLAGSTSAPKAHQRAG
jgi:hypothetical protein